ncbi:hypothetical protein C4097_09670 [Clostridioides difficile]|nr:hypothetical protein [Clostridioides difficile]
MKIYNKKGFTFGVLATILGICSLTKDIIYPEDWLTLQIKHVVFSIIILLFGIITLIRAFSKKATQEDRIESMDERNRLIKLKSEAKSGNIIFWITTIISICSFLFYYLTENILYMFIFIPIAILSMMYIIIEFISYLYYEKRE